MAAYGSGALGDTSTLAGAATSSALQQLMDDMKDIEGTLDSIEIPARGRCKVYMAKFGYDPFKQSPNDNPDTELAFNAGDYIMVFDNVDEDGYLIGELIDGRRGYVPSNWLDRLTGEDLFEFQASVLYKQPSTNLDDVSLGDILGPQAPSSSHLTRDLFSLKDPLNMSSSTAAASAGMRQLANTSSNMHNAGSHINDMNNSNALITSAIGDSLGYPPEFYEALMSDTMTHSNFKPLIAPEDYHRMNGYVDLDDVTEVDDECLSDYERAEAEQLRRAVPPPQRLMLERQFNKSILISWLHPQATRGTISSYQVYVDGVLKATIPTGNRTKALLEGVDSSIPHRISVRALDVQAMHSNDAGCTIVTGKVPFAPSCVKASHVTSDSALISWLPSNSNFHHVVAVNSVEVQTLGPGVYKHLINGLSANTIYRVWVRAKPGKILSNVDDPKLDPKKLESLTTCVDFKTLPKSLPDPPVNVQVEAGPQRRSLLVTWLPLTLNQFGSSNGCPVTGYAVFAGHKKLADIDSPTGDHALLDVTDLESLHKKSVTVRTKSGENLSQDSMPCQIPDEYLKNQMSSGGHAALAAHHHQLQQQHHAHQQSPGMIGRGGALVRQTSADPSVRRLASAGGGLSGPQAGHMAGHRHNSNPNVRSLAASQRFAANRPSRHNMGVARSLQNLESDFDSRRSSLAGAYCSNAVGVLDLATGSAASDIHATQQHMNGQTNLHTESYSEEEFESSMRIRSAGAAKASGGARGHLGNGSRMQQLRRSRQQRQLLQHQEVRHFVALFDYDPSTMSPNSNAINEELAFKKGSVIKVYGDKGADEFYLGELDNRLGYVPSNVVQELPRAPPPGQRGANQRHLASNSSSMAMADIQQQQGGFKRMVALYDYDPMENSPNADTESEIPFKVGDVIYVYGKMDTDGFYMGEVERTKQRGLVPSNFLREEPLTQQQQQQAQLMAGNGLAMANRQQPAMVNMLGQQQQYQQPTTGLGMNVQQQRLMNGQSQQAQQLPVGPNSSQIRANNFRSVPNQPGQPMQMQQQQQQQQQQQPQTINRPNSLMNSAGQQPMFNNPNDMMQQQQQHQMMQQNQVGGNQQMMQSLPQQQQFQQAQQPQQQQHGGVLSNLFSSGKQIIEAATNQRANSNNQGVMGGTHSAMGSNMGNQFNQTIPMQPQQLNQPMGQMGGTLIGGPTNANMIAGTNMMPNQNSAMMPMMSQQTSANQMRNPQANNPNMMALGPNNMNRPSAGIGTPQGLQTGVGSYMSQQNFATNQQQQQMPQQQLQQPLQQPLQQQQQQTFNNRQPFGGFGPTSGGLVQNPQQQQPQQQQHNFNLGGFNRGTAGTTSGGNFLGEDQGGNLLNTVRSIFKR